MSNEKHFPEGFIYKQKHPNAPDFVEGGCAIKVEEFQKWLSRVKGEWVNLDFKISKDGKPYAEVNTFKPDKSKSKPTNEIPDGFDDVSDNLPF